MRAPAGGEGGRTRARGRATRLPRGVSRRSAQCAQIRLRSRNAPGGQGAAEPCPSEARACACGGDFSVLGRRTSLLCHIYPGLQELQVQPSRMSNPTTPRTRSCATCTASQRVTRRTGAPAASLPEVVEVRPTRPTDSGQCYSRKCNKLSSDFASTFIRHTSTSSCPTFFA